MKRFLRYIYRLPGLSKSYALKFLVITFLGIHIPLIGLSVSLLILPNQIDSLTIFWIVLGFTLLGTGFTLYVLNYLIRPIQHADQSLLQYISNREIPNLSFDGQDELARLLNSMDKTILRTEELIEQKDDLIYLLSHDFRAPILKAKGMFELMRNESDKEFVEELSGKLADEMKTQLDLMESLLKLLKDDKVKLSSSKFQESELKDVISEVVSSSDDQIKRDKFRNYI